MQDVVDTVIVVVDNFRREGTTVDSVGLFQRPAALRSYQGSP